MGRNCAEFRPQLTPLVRAWLPNRGPEAPLCPLPVESELFLGIYLPLFLFSSLAL